MLKIEPVQLDIPKMTEQHWHDLLSARTEFILESGPDDPPPSHEVQKQFLSKMPELRDRVDFEPVVRAPFRRKGARAIQMLS